jgi:hypothetical protein
MATKEMYELMYPIGKYEVPSFIGSNHIEKWIDTIEETPTILRSLTESLHNKELSWQYRPHGWNIHQVVHHMSDSHTNALLRFKLALTEEVPTIKPYKEGLWVELADCKSEYLHHSLLLIEAVHAKFTLLLKSMSISDFHTKSYFHPESHKNFTLGEALGLYDWHCQHHTTHIKQALEFQGVFE